MSNILHQTIILMLDTLKLEKISISHQFTEKIRQKTRFLHTLQFNAAEKINESIENQRDERDDRKFSTKTASKSVIRLITNNEILGLEADTLEVIPEDRSSMNENDLDKVFFKVTNNPCENQLEFNYYLGTWDECSIRFSFLCEKMIDISTMEKMNIQDWIKLS